MIQVRRIATSEIDHSSEGEDNAAQSSSASSNSPASEAPPSDESRDFSLIDDAYRSSKGVFQVDHAGSIVGGNET